MLRCGASVREAYGLIMMPLGQFHSNEGLRRANAMDLGLNSWL